MGEDDAGEQAHVPGAVHPGRLDQLARNRQEMVAHEERTEGDTRERNDDSGKGVAPAPPIRNQCVVGDDGDLIGHHQRRDDQQEDGVLTRESQEDQTVCAEHPPSVSFTTASTDVMITELRRNVQKSKVVVASE